MKATVIEAILNGTLEGKSPREILGLNILQSYVDPLDRDSVTVDYVAVYLKGGPEAYPERLKAKIREADVFRTQLKAIKGWSGDSCYEMARQEYEVKLKEWEAKQVLRIRGEAEIKRLQPFVEKWDVESEKVQGHDLRGVALQLKDDARRIFFHQLNVKLPEMEFKAPVMPNQEEWRERKLKQLQAKIEAIDEEVSIWNNNWEFWSKLILSIPEA